MKAFNRPDFPAFPRNLVVLALCGVVVACGSGGGGETAAGDAPVVPIVTEVITGHVIDGYIEGARVCIDLNANASCDGGEAQVFTDAQGAYRLEIPKDSTAPLLADVIAGRSRDLDTPQTSVDRSFHMSSPSRSYSTTITPFTTLVHLAGDSNYALAEDIVRNEVGLPPRYAIGGDYVAAGDRYAQNVAKGIVVALKATADSGAMSASGLAAVVAALPSEITTLPQLRIATKNAAPILDRENYVDATFVLTNLVSPTPTVTLNGKIRGRGHSTWGMPKNPYKLQFSNDAAYAATTDFLGMKKQRNWALLADYFDRSLIRNKLAFSLANSSAFRDGMKWNPSVQHLEVWLNDEYIGVYLLAEDIRIDPNRLAIRSMSKSVAAGEVDGGYIVEADVRLDCYAGSDLSLQHVTPQGLKFCQSKPDEGDITMPQLAYVMNLLDATEADIYAGRIDGINLVSFVDYVLLNEFERVDDAQFLTSVFLWKDSATSSIATDRLVNMGPVWDFDRSAGNNNMHDHWLPVGCFVVKPYNPNWFVPLAANPQFVQLAVDRWKAKRSALERFVNASIETYTRRLDGAQQRNFAKWPIFGEPLMQYYSFATYDEEVAFVRRFLNERMMWLDEALATQESFATMCR